MTSANDRTVEKIENMCGGKGHVLIERLLGEKELDGKCGLYAKVTIEKDCTLGYHEHHGETETYYILSGEGMYDDNGKKYPVKAGDVICSLDMESSLAQYRAAEIGYTSAASSYSAQKDILDRQVALYEKNWNDTKALFEIGAASQSEVDQMELQYLSTKAQRDSTLAQLEASMQSAKSSYEQLALAMENIDSHGNVIAPVDGVLASLTASEGGMVSPSYAVAVIDGAEQMKVTVMVSEALVPKLAIGDTVTVRVSAADAEFEGVIRSVEKTANQVTKLYTVTVTVPAEVEGLLSGMFADVTFHTAVSESAVVVPSEAILTSSDRQYVFIVENDTAKRVDITTGLTGSGMTEVTSGLDAGEQLVTVGQQYLSDGDAVRVVEG